jgi:hypothetical protein
MRDQPITSARIHSASAAGKKSADFNRFWRSLIDQLLGKTVEVGRLVLGVEWSGRSVAGDARKQRSHSRIINHDNFPPEA